MILEAAERLDALHTDACERMTADDAGIPLRHWLGMKLAGGLYRLDHWLSLPWACRLTGHVPERHTYWNADACAVEEAWLECERCGNWLSHLPEGIRRGL